jgi:phospholipid/cholesterol/gamma-HCH transport system substrate-binding protein
MRATRGLKALLLSTALAVVLGGCSGSVSEMPLPGGTDVGDDPIEVKAEFVDVLDLVPQTTVKVNDVSVGKVTEIDLQGETAVVTMQLPSDVDLPANPVAEIRQTSLLGEKFVQLEAPATGASSEPLADGAMIDLDETGRNPEVEEVLGALSLVLNGGGVAQLKTIASELNLALEGREDSAKSVLRQIRDLMGQLDEGKADIVRAIEGLNKLSISLNDQIGTIDSALEELPSALKTLDAQRTDLVKMLQALNRLGDTGVRVIKASKEATIDSVQQLVPVLTQLANSGDSFVNSFHVFLTYPFVDEVVGRDPQVARNLHMGDYTNLSIQLDVSLTGDDDSVNEEGPLPDPTDPCTTLGEVKEELGENIPLDELLEYLSNLEDLCEGAQDAINTCLAKDTPQKIANCLEKKLGVTIPKITQDVLDTTCELLGVPADQCPDIGGGGGGGDGDGDGGILPDLPDLPGAGLFRAPFGERAGSTSGPTMGELSEQFDPALVELLVPGMVMTR